MTINKRNTLFALVAITLLLFSSKAHAACENPDGVAGNQMYNITHNVMQYCDGTDWIVMGSAGRESSSIWKSFGANIYFNTGYVGIGTDTPTSTLHVGGILTAGDAIRLADDSVVTGCLVAGEIRYNAANQHVEVCNGTEWVASSAGDFTPGSVPFAGADKNLTEDNINFNWDAVNLDLTVGRKVSFRTEAGWNAPVVEVGSGILSLTELDDVDVTNPQLDQVLKYNGTSWVNDVSASQIWIQNGNNINYATGNVGIDVGNPLTKLHVGGIITAGDAIRLANDSTVTACAAEQEGDIRYNVTDESIEVCTGTEWKTSSGGVDGLTASAVPFVSIDGELIDDQPNLNWDDTNDVLTVGKKIKIMGGTGAYPNLAQTLDTALGELADVTISTPSNSQVLTYNGTAWVNKPPASTSPALTGDVTKADGSSVTTISAGAVGTAKIADDAITAAKMADNSVGYAAIVNGAITKAKIANGTITSDEMADGAIIEAKLADGAVDLAGSKVTGSLAAANVSGVLDDTNIPALTGDVTKLAGSSATTISAGAVGATELANGAVNLSGTKVTGSLAAANVSGVLADTNIPALTGDVTKDAGDSATIITDGAVTEAKLADGAVDLAGAKITGSLDAANISGTIAATNSAALTGDVTKAAGSSATTISAGVVGTAELTNNAVTTGKIADGTIGTADIAADAITTAKIADGTIGTADLANNAVTNTKIADGTIGTADLANNAVTTGKIADGTVGSADLANGAVDLAGTKVTGSLDAASVSGVLDDTNIPALTGDVTKATGSSATTIAADAVALGTDTTGNYVAGVTAGTGISVGGTAGEGWTATITNTGDTVADAVDGKVTLSSSTEVEGTLPVANGGTGLTSMLTKGYILRSNGSTYTGDGNLFWDEDNGYFGVGTVNPGARLSVANGLQGLKFLTGTNTSAYTLDIGVNDDGVNFTNTSAIRGFNFINDNGTLLAIDKDGNVGIGTPTPAADLDIVGSFVRHEGYQFNAHSGASTSYELVNRDGGGFQFWTDSGAGNPEITFTNEGDIGIGTDTPLNTNNDAYTYNSSVTRILNIEGGDKHTVLAIEGEYPDLNLTNPSNNADERVMILRNLDGTTRFVPHLDSGTQKFSEPPLSISHSTGNVGIGDSTPTAKLQVTGNIMSSGIIGAGCPGNCDANFAGYTILTDDGIVRLSSGTVGAETKLSQNVNSALLVTTAHGYTEIGPQNSSWSHFGTDATNGFYFGTDITINGNISKYNSNYVTLSGPLGYVNIGSHNTSYIHFFTDRPAYYFDKPVKCDGGCTTYTSDLRLKKDIQPIDIGLNTLLKLNPVKFMWIDEEKNRALITNKNKKGYTYSFIAQELLEVTPEVVQKMGKLGLDRYKEIGVEEPEDGFFTIDPVQLISPIVKAIQELSGKHDEKDVRIKALEDEVKELKELIKGMK